MTTHPDSLLTAEEPAPVTVYNAGGSSPFLLVADHAGNVIPRALDRLGLNEADCTRHIAWDIGIGALAPLLADSLDAVLIRQNYSRLVIDCNRPPGVTTSIPDISELTEVPGNIGLSDAERIAREREIFRPYHDRIAAELDRRRDNGRPAALIALHSFTPVFKSVARSWHAALLYYRDPRLSQCLLTLLREQTGLPVGDNEPYFVSDATDFTIPVHGEARGLHHALVEIRQDLITSPSGQREWADILAEVLPQAYRDLTQTA